VTDSEFELFLIAYDQAQAEGTTTAFLAAHPLEANDRRRLDETILCLDQLTDYWSIADTRERKSYEHDFHQLSDPHDLTNSRIGRFEIRRRLGGGGFGLVYLAWDPLLERQVAIKVPRLEVAMNATLHSRTLREAKLAAGLDHPHIVAIHEIIEFEHHCCVVAAFCPGENLADRLRRQLPTPTRAAEIAMNIADALSYCHQRGIVHRDIKPANIMMVVNANQGQGETPKLMDFGLAKSTELLLVNPHLSGFIGTPRYMAPEQVSATAGRIGPATDIHALGITLYEMLVGSNPFCGEELASLLDQILHGTIDSVPDPHGRIPRPLAAICLRCLRKRASDRYPSAADLRQDLSKFLAGETIDTQFPPRFSGMIANLRETDRVINAGMSSLLIAGLSLGPVMTVCLFMIVNPKSFPDRATTLLVLATFVLLFCIPQFALGCFTLTKRRLALIAGLFFPPVLISFTVLMIVALPSLRQSLNTETWLLSGNLSFEALFVGLLMTQWVCYVLAVITRPRFIAMLSNWSRKPPSERHRDAR
jgi:serine/threonine protein kinase